MRPRSTADIEAVYCLPHRVEWRDTSASTKQHKGAVQRLRVIVGRVRTAEHGSLANLQRVHQRRTRAVLVVLDEQTEASAVVSNRCVVADGLASVQCQVSTNWQAAQVAVVAVFGVGKLEDTSVGRNFAATGAAACQRRHSSDSCFRRRVGVIQNANFKLRQK